MRKIWTIAWKDIYGTYTDRNLLIIMLLTPLAISTIIALAFSDISSGNVPIRDIPVAVVNLDEGTAEFNGGAIFVNALVPGGAADDAGDDFHCALLDTSDDPIDGGVGMSLFDLTDAVLLDDPDEAHAGVNSGVYAAAVIIPTEFSRSVVYSQDNPGIEPVPIEVYGDSGRPVSAGVIQSVVSSISNQILTGQITIAATIESMIERAQSNPAFGLRFLALNASDNFQPDFRCAFVSGLNTVTIEQQAVTGEVAQFNPLVVFGAAQAAFFALFTASGGATNILEERRNWTLPRLLMSPTPRLQILLGKLGGVFGMVLLQLAFLFIAFTVIGSLLEGQPTFIWGTNIPAIVILVVATAAAASGVGMVTVALARNIEQANIIGGIIAIAMGVLGGAFFTVDAIPLLEPLTRLSIVRWGSEGFARLAQGQSDILINVLFLGLIGAGMFAISLVIFNRRQDI
jgi:ABC-type Na+ efflux pump permease subunit